MSSQPLVIAGRTFQSRLILGTGKFSSPEAMREALAASGCGMVTVALRRADLSGERDPFANILEYVDASRYLLLPNTSGAMNAEEAVRLLKTGLYSQRKPSSENPVERAAWSQVCRVILNLHETITRY